MSYTNFLKDIIDLIYWNIDQFFNYFDLDNIKHIRHLELDKYFHEINNSEIISFAEKISKFKIKLWFPNEFFILNGFTIKFPTFPISLHLDKLIYFYYPLIESFQQFFIQLIRGEWINNFVNFSLVHNEFMKSIVNEDLFFKSQYTNSLTILQLPIYLDNKFFIGFLNSLFLSLPFSCNQLLCVYTSLVYGPRIGIFATLGWIIGQIFLFACILFGIKPLIMQWYSLEHLNYFLAIYLIILFLHSSIQTITKKISPIRKKKKNVDLNFQEVKNKNEEDIQVLKVKSFALHSFLSWTENGYLFSYFNNINTGSEPSVLDLSLVLNFNEYLSFHLDYLLGILFGCLFFSYLYNQLTLKFCLRFYKLGLVKLMPAVPIGKKRKTPEEYQRDRLRRQRKIKKGKKKKHIDFRKQIDEFNKKWEKREQRLEKERERLRDKYKYPYKYDYKFFEEVKETFEDYKEPITDYTREELRQWDIRNSIKNFSFKNFRVKQNEKKNKIDNFKTSLNIDIGNKENLYSNYANKVIKEFLSRFTIRLLILILGLTMASFSYYDISYILTNPLGFIPQDEKLKKIILHTNQEDFNQYGFGNNPDFRVVAESPNIGTDIMILDAKEYKNLLEFEDVNYQAEYAWLAKSDRAQGRPTPIKILKRKHLRQNKDNENLSIINYYKASSLKQESLNLYYKSNSLFNSPIKNNYFLDGQNLYRSTQWKDEMDLNFKLDFLPYERMKNWTVDLPSVQKGFEIEEEIKQKYYINPLYKILLNFEVDRFVSRWSNDMFLSEFEENDLFNRRKALSNYYESNFYYSQVNHFDLFRNFFFNSKSSLNNPYNQQFKGTLRILEKLFPITLDNNIHNRSVLKYDYPLIKNSNTNKYLHEELYNLNDNNQPNYKGLISTSSAPLFLGWNNQLNQLVITNNLVLKEIKNNDEYFLSSIDNENYMFNSMTLLNIQKLNNLMRHSYSILRSPLMVESFSNLQSSYDLDLVDDSSFRSVNKISLLSRIKPNKKLTYNWLGDFNWYSFRYENIQGKLDSSKIVKERDEKLINERDKKKEDQIKFLLK